MERNRSSVRATAALLALCSGVSCSNDASNSAAASSSVSAFVGRFKANLSATATVVTPDGVPPQTYTDTAIITVTAGDGNDIAMSWQVGENSPNGSILFAVSGDSATATGIGVGGTCWNGQLTNGNVQMTCVTAASAKIAGDKLTQEQSGDISGTTLDFVAYTGTYEGTWTGTRIRE